jgi:hypothetical protein
MLAPYEYLLPYRDKILGLYPEFASHPVFRDICHCHFAIIQVFRLTRTAPNMVSDIAYGPISSKYIDRNTSVPPYASQLDNTALAIYDTAWLNDQVLDDLEPFPECFDSSMLPPRWPISS